MKKRQLLILTVALSSLLFAACGNKKEESQASAETTEPTTQQETVSPEDPALKALEETVLPDVPKLSEMGSIELPKLSEIEVTASPMLETTDEEVDSYIKDILSQELSEVEGDSLEGDTLNIDYVGTMDGVAFDGGTAEGYDLLLGSGTFIPGFEDQLIGTRKGEKVTVKLSFPEDYGNTELAGKPAEFAVTVNAVKRAAELTDSWVESYKDTEAKTVSEFKEAVRAKLAAGYAYSYHMGIQQDALQQIVDASSIELSDAMKEYGRAYVLITQMSQMKSYGFDLASMINMYGMTVESFEEEIAAQGEDFARQYFVVQKIADEQGIVLSDELVDRLVEELSELGGVSYTKEELYMQFGQETVESEAVNNAVMSYVESMIKINVVEENTLTAG